MSRRVLVVGLDGATFDVVRPLAAQGRLPNLARMMADGAHGVMRSNIPPVTPSAWTSVFTGKNPGKHGIYDFQELDPATYRFRTIRTDEHQEKTIWQLLGEAGLRSIVVDVPFTYPPQPLNGLMLTGYGTPRVPGTVFTYPALLAERLPEGLRGEVRVALPENKFDRSRRFIEEWEALMVGRRKLLSFLTSGEPWDLFMVVFSITDNMAHVFWTYTDPAHPNYYRAEAEEFRQAFHHGYELCDQLLGELIEKAGPHTNTLVLSDHGFGSVRPRQYVYNRLLRGGYLVPRAAIGPSGTGGRLVRVAVNAYNRFPVIREWVKGLTPARRKTLTDGLKRSGIMPGSENVDFARSKVIPSNFGLRMWVNDRYRFAQGMVPVAEKEAVLSELSDFLKEDCDQATGEAIIANTYFGADLYHGPFAHRGPDLVIEYNNFFHPEIRPAARNAHLEGGHTLDGIFLAYGPDVQRQRLTGASLIDLAPTILYLLDQPVPADMDGRVLTEIIPAARLAEKPVRQTEAPARWDTPLGRLNSAGYSAEEEAEIEDQLRQLGYIE